MSDTETEADLTKREGQQPRPAKPRYLEHGAQVGRYVVDDKLGEGGMGVVYRARDPELDRRVAIKLLTARRGDGSASGGDQAWLLREAQALARLQHPNVVAVHDVGTVAGDQVFVAMELVDGATLRAWLKQAPRAWREVVPVLHAAGAGLAAAHGAGLVHRDFKPENVLVGHDGRVRVMDFGLARLRRDDDSAGLTPPPPSSSPASGESSKSPLSYDLTEAGHMVGTPAYMAPELYDGVAADARTDQFSFGVTLFEALYGVRPYERKQLAAARTKPPVAAVPANARVPAAIARVAARAIAIDPAQRFASMDDLLAALAIDPYARRRRALIGAGLIAAAGAIGGGVFALAHHRGPTCTGSERRLAGVWDSPTRAAVDKAFAAAKKPYAAASFAGISRALDGYTGQWTAAVTESCEATRVHGEQSEEVMALREACLDQRLVELGALVKLLAAGDAGLVDKGDKAIAALEPVADCGNVIALRSPGLPPPAIRVQVRELEAKLAEAKAQLIASNYLSALTEAKAASDGATALHWDPIVAEAYAIRAPALLTVGNFAEALQAYQDSTYAAIRGRNDEIAARSAFGAAAVLTDSLGKPGDAQAWVDLGAAEAVRSNETPALASYHYSVAAMVAAERGDINAGVTLYAKAYDIGVQVFGNNSAALGSIESDFGATLERAGAYGRAVPHFERAIAIRTASVGPDHPDIALTLSNLGLAYRHTHEYGKARASYERALALREKIYGKRSPILVATLDNFADLYAHEHDYQRALELMARAKGLAQLVPGPTHPMFHQLLTDYAEILAGAGKPDDARAMYDQAIELETQNASNVLPITLASRAAVEADQQHWPDAERLARESIAAFEAAGGVDNPALWQPLAALARARLGQHDAAGAKPLVERALAIAAKAQAPDDDVAPVRELLQRSTGP